MRLPKWVWQDQKTMLALAFPMIIANITNPLLGLVDTAVLGHLDHAAYLAGASVGALILTQIYWVCGFLRMSTTGLSAQAKGAQNRLLQTKVLVQGCVLALALSGLILLAQPFILSFGVTLANPDADVHQAIVDYFSTRVWGAPAALLNLVLIGWLVGQQKTRFVLVIQVVGNLVNAALDVLFAVYWGWDVAGVAFASVCAEYLMMGMGMWACLVGARPLVIDRVWLRWHGLKQVFSLNGDMFLRNLSLQACLAFMTLKGAQLGAEFAAVNAIIMQFFVLIALGLDGVAYAVEAKVGAAKGANNERDVLRHTHTGLLLSSVFACAYALVFAFFGTSIIQLLTSLPQVQTAATGYLWVVILLPLVGHWCFLFDGVFIGLADAKAMRNTMFISAVLVYFPVWWLNQSMGNTALWIALLSFLLARGMTLGAVFYRQTVWSKT